MKESLRLELNSVTPSTSAFRRLFHCVVKVTSPKHYNFSSAFLKSFGAVQVDNRDDIRQSEIADASVVALAHVLRRVLAVARQLRGTAGLSIEHYTAASHDHDLTHERRSLLVGQ